MHVSIAHLDLTGPRLVVEFVLMIVIGACVQTYRVVRLRRKGKNWTEALTNSNKFMTGSVWTDALALVLVLAVVFGALFIFLWK